MSSSGWARIYPVCWYCQRNNLGFYGLSLWYGKASSPLNSALIMLLFASWWSYPKERAIDFRHSLIKQKGTLVCAYALFPVSSGVFFLLLLLFSLNSKYSFEFPLRFLLWLMSYSGVVFNFQIFEVFPESLLLWTLNLILLWWKSKFTVTAIFLNVWRAGFWIIYLGHCPMWTGNLKHLFFKGPTTLVKSWWLILLFSSFMFCFIFCWLVLSLRCGALRSQRILAVHLFLLMLSDSFVYFKAPFWEHRNT